jgi:hypothetical protein
LFDALMPSQRAVTLMFDVTTASGSTTETNRARTPEAPDHGLHYYKRSGRDRVTHAPCIEVETATTSPGIAGGVPLTIA